MPVNITKRYTTDEILSNCNCGVWIWNIQDGLFTIKIPSLDIKSEEDTYTVDKILEKIHPEDLQRIQLDKNNLKLNLNEVFNEDLRIRFYNDEYVWFNFRGFCLEKDLNQKPILFQGIYSNINSRKQKEIVLRQEIDRLRAQNEAHDVYFSNLTHEIRTPLQAILGFSDIIASTDDQQERNKYLEYIRSNNNMLLSIINNLSDISKTDHKLDELKEDVFSLWEFMVEIQQVYSQKTNPNVKLIFSNSYDDHKLILDKNKLSQIMGTLLSNAVKYTHSGYINYGYEFTEDKVIIVVNDTGDGIAETDLSAIFDRIDAPKDVLSDNVGLSFCKTLITKMQGNITVNSKVGAGTSFTVELPLTLDIINKEDNFDDQISEPIVDKKDKVLPTLLVAEDVVYNYLMLKTLLEDRFNVVLAENGQQAVEMFKKMKPSFIFMDIKMPVMDGLEATKIIRSMDSEVPIIVLTAYAVRSLRKEASEVGFTDMLTKPTTAKQINATIRKYLK